MKNGVARREADAPKVLVKRDILVGKIDDVPKPAIDAPTLKSQTFFAESKIIIPSKIVKRLNINTLFSFRKRKKIGATPIWIFHGAADPTVPVTESQKMDAALKAAGADVRYTEYPGVGHNSWDKAYAEPELAKWLFEQRLK